MAHSATDLLAMIREALDAADGVAYLRRQAYENPPAFLALVAKCLPGLIVGGDGQPLFPSRIEIVTVEARG